MSIYTLLDGTSLYKKNSKEVGYKECDKSQQHKVCYQQDNERSEFLDYKKYFPSLSPLIHIRLLGCPSRQCFGFFRRFSWLTDNF